MTSRKNPPILSPGQKKLETLGIKLPLFPLTSVGSLPKNQELQELRYKVQNRVLPPEELTRKEKLATELWIRSQERFGLDILVDGEQNRSDIVSFFAEKIGGFSPGGSVRCYGNRYYQKPIITGKLEWRGPMVAEDWKALQRATHKPLKALVTGPYTLMEWSFNDFYGSREQTLEELTKIIRKEIEALSEAGAKIIQIDEPALSCRPHEFPFIFNAIKELTAGQKAYFILHHAYGDLTPIWEKMQKLPVDNFDLEVANSGTMLHSLLRKIPTKKDISMGIIDSHNHLIDSPRQINDRIRTALRVVPKNQLWFSPDCGLKTRTTDEAIGKLTQMVRAVTKFR